MFRLEKIFQNDDLFFINFLIIIKSIVIFSSIYIFSILEFNSIYNLLNFTIFKNSKLYDFSIYLTLFYLISSLFFRLKKRYTSNFLSFLQQDLVPILPAVLLTFSTFFYLKTNFNIDFFFIYLFFFIIFNLFLLKKIMNFLYFYLI